MKRIAYAVAFIVLFPILGKAQELPTADNRYNGYPISIVWPSQLPDLLACEKQEYYEPADLHLTRYESRVQVASIPRVQEHDECVWMLTRFGWRWILRPAGTKVAVDAQRRDLFDFGSPTGMKCANPRPFGIPILPPTPPQPTVMPPIVFLLPPLPAPPSPPTPPRLAIPPIEKLVMPEPPRPRRVEKKSRRGLCSGTVRNLVCMGVIFAAGSYMAYHFWPDGGESQPVVIPPPVVLPVGKPVIPNPGVP